MLKTTLWIVGTVLFFWAAARLLESRITYYPFAKLMADPSIVGLDFEDVWITTDDGINLHGWYCRPPEETGHRADLLFFHGNGGNISHRLANIKGLADIGLGVLIFDYRGYGRSDGRPNDEGILKDVGPVYEKLRELTTSSSRPLGLFGRSLGALLAVRLASGNEGVDFVILEGSFMGKRAVALRYPPFWPFYPFISRTLDMEGYIQRISCPLLVMHASYDEIIPFALGREVFREAGQKAEFYEIVAGGHNDTFLADGRYYRRLEEFLDKILPGCHPDTRGGLR